MRLPPPPRVRWWSLPLALATLVLASFATAEDDSEPRVPPIPRPEFQDSELGAEFARGIELLEERKWKEARSLLRKIRRRGSTEEEEAALERAYREAEGHYECEKIAERIRKGDLRRALALAEKEIPRYPGTQAGVRMEELRQEAFDALFHVIDDFEPKSGPKSEDAEDDGEGEGGPGRGGRGGGYGPNTKVVKGSPEAGNVRHGAGALEWRTGKELAWVSFDQLDNRVQEYRYLNLAVRCEDSKNRPQLLLLFDPLETGLPRGGGAGRGGRRGAARAFQRDGFQYSFVPDGGWQELRLDLRKFNRKGEFAWEDVRFLRIVHLPGVSASLTLDSIRLERE